MIEYIADVLSVLCAHPALKSGITGNVDIVCQDKTKSTLRVAQKHQKEGLARQLRPVVHQEKD